jgi:thiol-disulfide isomerase/thioredoxin
MAELAQTDRGVVAMVPSPFLSLDGGEAMRRLSGFTLVLVGMALLTSGCLKLDIFKRAEGPLALAKGPRVGYPAPEIEGEDFDGKRLKLSDYRGKVVVVTFWASWCRYCLERIPHEQALVQRYQGKPFAFLGVNNDENREVALKVIASHGITWRNWQTSGTQDSINQRWGVKEWPTTCVIDAKGIVRYMRVSGPHLENAIETLLAEAEKTR